jgi:YHS domain-containing protein
VTDAGVASLKKAVPSVIVNRGEELAIVVKPPEPAPAPKAAATATVTAATAKPLNSVCPVSGKAVVLPNVLTHEGKLVGFCCDKCPKAFEKEPAKYAANIKFDIAPPAAEKKPDAKPTEKPKADAPAAEKKPADAKPVDAKPVEKKTEEKKPADAKPADAKPDAKAAADAKPAAAAAAAAVATVNTKCPVSDHPIETGFTALVDNRTVGFCCDKCLAKFNKEPAKYADKIVADAKN